MVFKNVKKEKFHEVRIICRINIQENSKKNYIIAKFLKRQHAMKIIMFFGRHKGYHLQKMAKTSYLGMPVDGIWMNCMKISGMQFAKLAMYMTHNKKSYGSRVTT